MNIQQLKKKKREKDIIFFLVKKTTTQKTLKKSWEMYTTVRTHENTQRDNGFTNHYRPALFRFHLHHTGEKTKQ